MVSSILQSFSEMHCPLANMVSALLSSCWREKKKKKNQNPTHKIFNLYMEREYAWAIIIHDIWSMTLCLVELIGVLQEKLTFLGTIKFG